MTYRVRDWERHFEKADTKRCHSTKWVPVPNKWDGKSYRRLMKLKDGPALFGAWVLIIQVASRCPVRGILSDDDGPLGAKDLADKTGCPVTLFERALQVLSSKDIGWLTKGDSSELHGNFRDVTEKTGLQDRTGQDKTEQVPPSEVCSEPPPCGNSEPASGGEQPAECAAGSGGTRVRSPRGSKPAECASRGSQTAAVSAAVMAFPCVGKGPTEWPLTETKLAEYRLSFPGVDVLLECRKARQWCVDNSTKRKTFGGMPAFLSRWLSRAQDSGGSRGGQTLFDPRPTASREQQRLDNFAREAAKFAARHSGVGRGIPEGDDGPRLLETNG